MKQLALTVAVAAVVAITSAPVVIQTADAKSFSSSRSFSSSSYSRSSYRSSGSSWGSKSTSKSSSKGSFWGSSSKTSEPKTTSNKSFSSSNSSKNGSVKTSSAQKTSVAKPKQSVRTKQVVKAKRQEAKFKKPASVPGLKTSNGKKPSRVAANKAYRNTYKSNPVYNKASSHDSSTYWDRRSNYYGSYEPPMYVYNSSPAFGMWDTIFLYSLLNNSSNAGSFAHHHQNDPDYQAWRREAETLAKDNADLRKQLNDLDAQAQASQYNGTPIDPGYLPSGVDADIALAQGARQSTLPEWRVCTGSRGDAYFLTTAGVIAPNVDIVNTIPVITHGTGESLEFIREGKCDAAYVQADGYWNYIEDNQTTELPFKRMFSPYRESVHMICHADGPDEVSDLDSSHKVWFPANSGAAVTFRNWIGEDEDYAKVQTVLTKPNMVVESNEEALMKVSQDKNSCMMYVGAAGASEFIKNANAGAKGTNIVLIDIDDGDLNDTTDPSGSDVYKFTQFDERLYNNLTRQAGYIYGGGDVDTLTVAADFIVSTKWAEANKAIYPKLYNQVIGLTPRIQAVVKPRY
jgi:TRAP-type uncharacterized transport system substrate-binding protein